jgi:hypothetical protein
LEQGVCPVLLCKDACKRSLVMMSEWPEGRQQRSQATSCPEDEVSRDCGQAQPLLPRLGRIMLWLNRVFACPDPVIVIVNELSCSLRYS